MPGFRGHEYVSFVILLLIVDLIRYYIIECEWIK